jgi:hypothetical protein
MFKSFKCDTLVMNEELVYSMMIRTNDIYSTNGRSIPNAFRMRRFLRLNELKKYQFGEFVCSYKNCNDGYF